MKIYQPTRKTIKYYYNIYNIPLPEIQFYYGGKLKVIACLNDKQRHLPLPNVLMDHSVCLGSFCRSLEDGIYQFWNGKFTTSAVYCSVVEFVC